MAPVKGDGKRISCPISLVSLSSRMASLRWMYSSARSFVWLNRMKLRRSASILANISVMNWWKRWPHLCNILKSSQTQSSLALTFLIWAQSSWAPPVSCANQSVVVLCHIRLRLGRTVVDIVECHMIGVSHLCAALHCSWCEE